MHKTKVTCKRDIKMREKLNDDPQNPVYLEALCNGMRICVGPLDSLQRYEAHGNREREILPEFPRVYNVTQIIIME